MSDSPIYQFIEWFFKVPAQPKAPFGAPNSSQIFRAARNFYYYQVFHWLISHFFIAMFMSMMIFALIFLPDFIKYLFLRAIGIFILAIYLMIVLFSFLLVRINYEMRWYIITDRSLRIREGVIFVTEKTMSFANIQNISIHQGPIQRLLGIKDLKVRSAGGGTAMNGEDLETNSLHEAFFRGISNAEEIRNAIMNQIRKLKDTGLGDPDDKYDAESNMTVTNELVKAVFDMLNEVRKIKSTLKTQVNNN